MTAGPHAWWVPVAGSAGAWVARALEATWRIEVRDDPAFEEAVRAGEPVIYAFWHAQLLPLLLHHRHKGIAALVSQHRDGEIVARVIESLGYVTARGSSTRGGDSGLREMLRWAKRGRSLGISPDGPRGPARVVKSGLIYLAARLGLRIVPLAGSSRHEWVGTHWDRFRVPHAFSRLHISHGAPLRVPPEATQGEAAEAQRLRVQQALIDVAEAVRLRAGARP